MADFRFLKNVFLVFQDSHFRMEFVYLQIKNRPYLENFLTNPYTFFTYSGDLGPESPEYTKKV